MTLDDAADIAALRSSPRCHLRLHPVSPDVEEQRLWLDSYFAREGDYYFAVTRNLTETTEGFVGVYGVELHAAIRRAEWGRWVLRHGSLAAAESALLTYAIAFDDLALDEVFCRTVASNHAVISFHDRFNFRERSVIENAFDLGGPQDAVEHRAKREDQAAITRTLGPIVNLIAKRLGS